MPPPLPPPSPAEIRHVAVVLNGRAGALLADRRAAAALAGQFTAAGLRATFIPPRAGTLAERLAEAIRAGADAIIVGGGDGTIACAAACLAGAGTPLGILPFGTMNLLARDLGIPVGDTEAAIAVLRQGQRRSIDVGTVNDEIFLCASMLGLPARLARHRERGRHVLPLLAWSRFALAALRALMRADTLSLAISAEGGARRVTAQAVTVTVNALGAASGRAFGRPVLDGGQFALYLLGRLRLRDVLRLGWRALTGRIEADPAVREFRLARLVIGARGRHVRVMNDGEVRLLRPPLRYRLEPRALVVLAPPTGR